MAGEPTGDDWLLMWAGTISLLRAISHVLLNEDVETNAELKVAHRRWYDALNAKKSDSPIFFEFIVNERNIFLKRFDLRAGQSVTVAVTGVSAGMNAATCALPVRNPLATPSPIYTYHMNAGHFAGSDPRELVREAIEWWEAQLTTIEQAVETNDESNRT